MSDNAVQPLVWMRQLRDHAHFTGGTLNVLLMLALRMRKDGSGFASQLQLAGDAGVSEKTVRRAISAGREAGYVMRTRRGHRIDDGTAVASEYRLTLPTQPAVRDLLDHTSQPVARDRLESVGRPREPSGETRTQPVISEPNRSSGTTQPDTGDHPRGLQPEVFSTSVLNQGFRSTVVDVEEDPSETDVVNLAALLHGRTLGLDDDEVSDVWHEWENATQPEKARARGQARKILRGQVPA